MVNLLLEILYIPRTTFLLAITRIKRTRLVHFLRRQYLFALIECVINIYPGARIR